MKNLLVVIGTRPEAIKMAPVIEALKASDWARTYVVATAQHREMLDQVLALFGIHTDVDLNIMRANQALPELTARLITGLNEVVTREQPDAVLAQGDTTTVMVAALVAFYSRIPFGHVEAGLRTGDLMNPFPEEMNRVVAGRLARWHFAPTKTARANLVREGIDASHVSVTGNTVIDALLEVADKELPLGVPLMPDKRLILVTAHRRENFGQPFDNIIAALQTIADNNLDVEILYPVHPNPNVSRPVHARLGNHPRIVLCDPLDYGPFVSAMKKATIVLTDSGGVQEEAPALGKPVLVMRTETERPEAVEEGVVRLVGTDTDRIVEEVNRLLRDPVAYREMAKGASPYGDGKAAGRIVRILAESL